MTFLLGVVKYTAKQSEWAKRERRLPVQRVEGYLRGIAPLVAQLDQIARESLLTILAERADHFVKVVVHGVGEREDRIVQSLLRRHARMTWATGRGAARDGGTIGAGAVGKSLRHGLPPRGWVNYGWTGAIFSSRTFSNFRIAPYNSSDAAPTCCAISGHAFNCVLK